MIEVRRDGSRRWIEKAGWKRASHLPVRGRLVRFLSLSWLEQVSDDEADDIELVIEADDDDGDEAVEKVEARCRSMGDGLSSSSPGERRWFKSSACSPCKW